MATANRKKLHKRFIRGRDPMGPLGDGALNLLQQVEASLLGGGGGTLREERKDQFSSVSALHLNTQDPTGSLMSEDSNRCLLL